MPTMVKTFWKWGLRPKVWRVWPRLLAAIIIWMTRAMPLELRYSTLEKSRRMRLTWSGRPSEVPMTAGCEALVMSPEKRSTVMGSPLALGSSSTVTRVTISGIDLLQSSDGSDEMIVEGAVKERVD